MSGNADRITFVTGKLAAPALESILAPLGQRLGFEPIVNIQKISVAALMTVDWLRGKLQLAAGTKRVILPGIVKGNIDLLAVDHPGINFERGPENLLDLPQYLGGSLGGSTTSTPTMNHYDIEILSEINHANRLAADDLLKIARRLTSDGANMIDLGATPGEEWTNIEQVVRRLVDEGMRVSIDSFQPDEVRLAIAAGASLVLSVNSQNWSSVASLGTEVVVIPDDPHGPAWLDELLSTSDRLKKEGIPHRLDPILDPIGFGFASSLARYFELRRNRPEAKMMMGIGNLTELTEVDSAGVNVLLIALCQETRIQSVLTTEVINWARTSTREVDIARRIMHESISQGRLPKHMGGQLSMLRDPRLHSLGRDLLRRMQREVRDPNFRLFVDADEIVAFNADLFEAGTDPFLLFDRLGVEDPSHAFYLGWEMMKASLAIQLGKEYTQDRSLRWGFLTTQEISHRDRLKQDSKDDQRDDR
jgi:dihydropteroate synthase-like protein